MPTYLDQQPIPLIGKTLGDILSAAARQLGSSGRMIVEVHVDGVQLDNVALDQSRAHDITAREVRLFSADPRTLAVTALTEVRKQLDDAGDLQKKAAESLQQDRPTEAMQHLAQLLSIWQSTQQTVLQCSQFMNVQLDQKQFEGKPVSVLLKDLIDQLRNFRTLLSPPDTVAIADAMAYEWPPMLDRWKRLLEEMIDWVQLSGTKNA